MQTVPRNRSSRRQVLIKFHFHNPHPVTLLLLYIISFPFFCVCVYSPISNSRGCMIVSRQSVPETNKYNIIYALQCVSKLSSHSGGVFVVSVRIQQQEI